MHLTFFLARFDLFPGFDFTLSGKGQIGALAKKKNQFDHFLSLGGGRIHISLGGEALGLPRAHGLPEAWGPWAPWVLGRPTGSPLQRAAE